MKKIGYVYLIVLALLTGCNSEPASETQTENTAVEVTTSVEITEEASLPEVTTIEATTEEATTEEATLVETTTEETTTEEATTEAPTTEAPPKENTVYEMLDLAETMADADCSLVSEEYAIKKESIAADNEIIAGQHSVPVICITTEGGQEVKTKTEYIPVVVDVVGCDEEYKISATAGIRVRGNSTAGTADKPYRIKFEEKQNMLGLHEGKKYRSWVLLKADWNVCSDYTGLSLAKTVLSDYVYSSDCTFVIVYINGENKGIYTLCEQNQVNKGRVEIKEADLTAEYPEAPEEIGYYLEIDNNPSEENPYFKMNYNEVTVTDYAGETRQMCKDSITIKSDITTKEQYNFIKNYMEGSFTIMYEACCNNTPYMFDENYNLVSAEGVYTPEQAVEAVIDVDSFINMTILYELTQDYDVGAGSFYFAVDFSEDATFSRLTCVAPWDFNWGYEEDPTKNYYACAWLELLKENWDRSNIWLIVPMTADWYQQRVYTRWQELSKSKELDKVLKTVESDVDVLKAEVGDKEWRIDCAKKVINFVRKRIKFLDKNWN